MLPLADPGDAGDRPVCVPAAWVRCSVSAALRQQYGLTSIFGAYSTRRSCGIICAQKERAASLDGKEGGEEGEASGTAHGGERVDDEGGWRQRWRVQT